MPKRTSDAAEPSNIDQAHKRRGRPPRAKKPVIDEDEEETLPNLVAAEKIQKTEKTLEPAADHGMDDFELELQSLFQLDYDASTKELPKAQEIRMDGFVAQSVAAIDSASLIPDGTTKPEQVPKKPDRSKKNLNRNATDKLFAQYASLAEAESIESSPPKQSPRRLHIPKRQHDPAVESLINSLKGFIAPENESENFDSPLIALPAPSDSVIDGSALTEYRHEMALQHKRLEVPLPVDEDVARMLTSLPDGCGIHLQLPALAFPATLKSSSSDARYIHIGSLDISPVDHSVQLKTPMDNHTFCFGITQNNIPSKNAEIFQFVKSSKKNGESDGKVFIYPANLTASFSGTSRVQKSSTDGNGTLKTQGNLLLNLAQNKRNTLARTFLNSAERKKPGEPEPSSSKAPPPLLPPKLPPQLVPPKFSFRNTRTNRR